MSTVLLCLMARQNAMRWECRGLRVCLTLAQRVPLPVRDQSCTLVRVSQQLLRFPCFPPLGLDGTLLVTERSSLPLVWPCDLRASHHR